ncbi:MAG: rhomboid family intramembrane serine protease [Jatrophihabitantaceae bacterium]
MRELPFTLSRRGSRDERRTSEPPFDPTSWTGALIVMGVVTALLWGIQIANAGDDYGFNRFGLQPRSVDGLWGILTQPFLHQSYGHLLSNTLPLVAIGWALLLSGVRVFVFVTAVVIVLGDAATWLVAPSGQIVVGASGMIFGWAGYLLARAFFSRRLKWIVVAVLLLVFFGTLLGGALPTGDDRVSWQSHLCGALAGVLVGWLLHPRKPAGAGRTPGAAVR